MRKAEADEAEDKKNAAAKKLRVAASSAAGRGGAASRKTNARAVLLAAKGSARKSGKQSVVRLASESSTWPNEIIEGGTGIVAIAID